MTLKWIQALTREQRDELVQFAWYFAVSGCALCVDFSIYWVLLKLAPFAFLAAAGGYVCGVLTHYMLSSRIVFRARFHKRGLAAEAPAIVKFCLAGAMGLVVTSVVVGLLADVLGVHPMMAKVMAAGCSFVIVFLCMRFFVFNQPSHAVAQPA